MSGYGAQEESDFRGAPTSDQCNQFLTFTVSAGLALFNLLFFRRQKKTNVDINPFSETYIIWRRLYHSYHGRI